MQHPIERLRDAMETEGVIDIRRIVFNGKTVGFKVQMEDGGEGVGLTPREAIESAVKVAA